MVAPEFGQPNTDCFTCQVRKHALRLETQRKLATNALYWLRVAVNNLRDEPTRAWPGIAAISKELQASTSGLGRGKTRVTLMTLDGITPLSNGEKAMVMLNVPTEEHTLVSWLVWMRLAGSALAIALDIPFAMLPLRQIPILGPILDLLRLAPSDDMHDKALLGLRKFGTLAGRDLEQANWLAERLHSATGYVDRGRHFGHQWYLGRFRHYARMLAVRTVNNLIVRRQAPMATWWSKRFTSTPAGSSSMRHSADPHRSKLHGPNDRANKRVVWAHLPEDFPQSVLRLGPHCVGRCSTKPEPGRKHRALYAACDCSTIIASYASLGIEDAARWGGMVARQSPSDVQDWLEAHLLAKGSGCWLSLDYSDFNKEHRAWEMAALNMELYYAWDMCTDPAVKADKQACAIWTAASHFRRSCSNQESTWEPPEGLWSGHRDTARDNTMLHWIYQQIQQDVCAGLDPDYQGIVKTYMCGDDEDTLMCRQRDAVLYYAVGSALGWNFNPRKQMLSPLKHEFLQFACNGMGPVTQPLIPSIVAFVSGNWYKDPLIDAAGMAESMLRVGLEMINRGADQDAALALVHRSTSLYYKWLYRDHVRWDSLLSQAVCQHPVFAAPLTPPTTTETSKAPGAVEAAVWRMNPTAYVTALKRWWPLLEHVAPGQRKAVLLQVKLDALRSWFGTAWNKEPPLPGLDSGHVPPFVAVPVIQAPIGLAHDIGAHNLFPDEAISGAKLAGITGIPLPILNAVDLSVLSRTRDPMTHGYLQLLDKQTPWRPMRSLGVVGSLNWLN